LIEDGEKLVQKDDILLLVASISVTFYCISTETRFLDDNKKGVSSMGG
jgi:hypothetical protein